MIVVRSAGLSAVFVATWTFSAYAGPCSTQIEQTRIRIEAKLGAQAAAGSSAPESSNARLHRQPTPNSITSAEETLGEVSNKTVELVNWSIIPSGPHMGAQDHSSARSPHMRALLCCAEVQAQITLNERQWRPARPVTQSNSRPLA